MGWIYKNESFSGIIDVAKKIGTFKTIEEEFDFIESYCKAFAPGRSNLAYYVGDPYAQAFEKHHPFNKQISEFEKKIASMKKTIDDDFKLFSKSRSKATNG